MKNSRVIRGAIGAALLVFGLSAGPAFAGVITQWNFENQPITNPTSVTTPPVPANNSPAPSTGTGTAGVIGMNVYATPNVGVAAADITLGVTGDTGTNTNADTTQIWRVRAQDGGNGAANGWSSAAPIGTQGAQFFASTAGYNAVNISFDWYATNKGEANLLLQYTTNGGTTWTNVPITLSAADTGATVKNNTTSSNTVIGSYVSGGTGGQQWFPGLSATINDPLAANNPNFGIEMVNASTGADDLSISGAALNNSSGNWRFDNVTISGTAVPEPASLCLFGIGGLSLLARRRKIAR